MNTLYNINCKYYSREEFSKLFNQFHSNVNGYECHAHNLQETLVGVKPLEKSMKLFLIIY